MRTRFLFSEGFGFDLDVPPFPLPPKTPNAMGNPDYPLSKYRKDLILTSRDFSSNEINNDIFKKKKNKIAKAKKSFQNPKHEKLIKKYFFAMSKKVFCLRFRSPLPTGLKFKKILITKFVPILVTSLFVEKQLITITVKVRMLSQWKVAWFLLPRKRDIRGVVSKYVNNKKCNNGKKSVGCLFNRNF